MLQNAYLLAKIGADTAENEQKFAAKFAKNVQLPYGFTTLRSIGPPASLPPGRTSAAWTAAGA